MLRKRSFLRGLLLSAALGVSVMIAPVVQAQTPATDTARATELFKNGKAAFAKGEMAEAARLFAQALEIRKSSDIAANLAQAELEQQKYRSAAEHFSWALLNLLPSATDAQRKAVETGLARARAEVAVLRLEIKPEGAEVLVGSQMVGKAPIAGGVFVEPGEVIVSAKRDGFVAIDKRVVAGKGTEQAIEIELTPQQGAEAAPAAPALAVDSGLNPSSAGGAAPVDRGARKSLVPAFVATGVAVAGGMMGLVLTLTASSKENEADDLRDRLLGQGGCGEDGGAPPSECADLTSDRESVDASRNLAVGAFVVGGVAAAVAGYFYWDALSHRAKTAVHRRQRLVVLPSVEVGRAAAAAPVQAVRLNLSGTF
ncbi:MAG TPA: PEGA domain-containing protein [Polyangiaceae bacterium]|nr:PEGA domain-containing protein [Polyangiaceae bacterium]